MPGSGRCARCGGLLALVAAAIDVHPPRAGRMARRVPRLRGRFWTHRQEWANFRSTAARALAQLFAPFDESDFNLEVWLRLIVPGWAHHRRANPYRAKLFFLGYLALLLPGMVFVGTWLGGILLGLAFGLHVVAASDALFGRFATLGDRIYFTIVCAAALALVLYVPVGWLASRVAAPIRINQPIEPFAAGDVLWYHPTTQIATGDFVLYEVPEMSLAGTNSYTRNVFGNRWIDRVAAMPGQRVRLKGGQLFVDGSLSPWHPTTDVWANIESEFVVPDDHVFVPPNSLPTFDARISADVWRRLSLVPKSSVDGRIFFRSQPLWRLSIIRGIE